MRAVKSAPAMGEPGAPSSHEDTAARRAKNMPAQAVVAELQKYARSVGLVLCCRCAACGAPLFNAESVSKKLGPTCRRRSGDAA